MNQKNSIAIVGGGLAGCEAAWQLALQGFQVTMFEMRPLQSTAAHQTDHLAELVCSNSLKSRETHNAHGLLKAELNLLGCKLLELALASSVPAGAALAVDPTVFSAGVEEALSSLDNLKIERGEIHSAVDLKKEFDTVIIATGPLTSGPLSLELKSLAGDDGLYFYDAIAPVIYKESIDLDRAFFASRYGKSGEDYINCPLNRDEYYDFVQALVEAEKVPFKEYEQAKHFEGCLPLEVMAGRGLETLAFGPFKPVGLEVEGKRPYAVVQLRQENKEGTLYNLVGCQTRMTYGEQKRLFRKLPGLAKAEFARLGSMHRNSYINAPKYLNEHLELKSHPGIYIAGQLTGVEGYVESIASGLWVARQVAASFNMGMAPRADRKFILGALMNYLMEANQENFQPMNVNFGLMEAAPKQKKMGKRERREMQAQAALEHLQGLDWL